MLNKAMIARMLSATVILAASITISTSYVQSGQEKDQPAPPLRAAASTSTSPSPRAATSIIDAQMSKHAENYYKSVWGIEKLEVRETASGVLLRFSYYISDAKKAVALNDKKATPYLVDEKTGAVLQIPQMPKVGFLRQTANPEDGMEYWMVFSNKGNFVKPRSRVDVIIGQFRANGLIVR